MSVDSTEASKQIQPQEQAASHGVNVPTSNNIATDKLLITPHELPACIHWGW